MCSVPDWALSPSLGLLLRLGEMPVGAVAGHPSLCLLGHIEGADILLGDVDMFAEGL